jgi:hypothetical protein
MRNKLVLLSLICVLALGASSAQAIQFLDTFDSGLSAYTATDVLANGVNAIAGTPPTPNYPTIYTIANSGSNNYVTINRNTTNYPEQQVLMTNQTLDIGETLRVDLAVFKTSYNADLGLAVGATVTPPGVLNTTGANMDLRQNFLTMYMKDGSSGWGNVDYVGTVNVAGQNGFTTNMADYPNITGVWIYHNAPGVFTEGVTTSDNGDVTWRTITGATWDSGNGDAYVGLYADVRTSPITYGQADNLRIVPEPATLVMALLGICGMGLIWLRKRR